MPNYLILSHVIISSLVSKIRPIAQITLHPLLSILNIDLQFKTKDIHGTFTQLYICLHTFRDRLGYTKII